MDSYKTRATLKDTSFFSTLIITSKNGTKRLSIRAYRFFTIILVHLLFWFSYHVDIQILEGSISGSRAFGFHLSDPFIVLEVLGAFGKVELNLIIGAVSILFFYLIFGGRAFCGWICPYGLISEIGEKINAKLIAKNIIKKRKFTRISRYVFWVLFLASSYFSGYLVFEVINVVGILSRFIIYGFSLAILWLVAVFLVELFFARRVWCACFCPVGTTYSLLVSKPSFTKIQWDKDRCDHCGVCVDVCFVGDILELTKKNSAISKEQKKFRISGIDCTLCGRCVDVCHHDALKFDNLLKRMV
ncbi:NapH/MauN family ferredoxin-type protein [Campylobacter geochelonis]|uniref:NapH/MauN family ferredoxin-type protein n=1 Tax=Campylobacter geochelonis TaxID=1780362 RepID=A0A128ECB4_9BACT|nr:NapH/MauN family ferredoxin-type protein [Campylobacter geochelonis]QKF72161.1 menaquinol dehydrogenase NosGH, membrane component NosH [Campylobacter geochelonis]CZE46605.1 NapH/MauN family ferredoxin-type protein [Campylobacter geochelonis]